MFLQKPVTGVLSGADCSSGFGGSDGEKYYRKLLVSACADFAQGLKELGRLRTIETVPCLLSTPCHALSPLDLHR